jgi:hypothetical protein
MHRLYFMQGIFKYVLFKNLVFFYYILHDWINHYYYYYYLLLMIEVDSKMFVENLIENIYLLIKMLV